MGEENRWQVGVIMESFEKEIREDITDIKITVKAIETTLAEQPKHYDGRFKEHDRRISGLENNQRWLVLAVIGSLLTAVMNIILK